MLEELLGNTPTGIAAGNGYGHLAILCATRGQYGACSRRRDRGERFVGLSGGSMWLAPLAEARITGELWADRPSDAATIVDTFLPRWRRRIDPLDGTGSTSSARARRPTGRCAPSVTNARPVAARARAAELLARADDLIAPLFATPIRVRASRQAAAAEAARINGGDPAGPAAWERAAQLWSECDDAYQVAYAPVRRAEAMLVAGGRSPGGRERSARAHRRAARLGARPLADAIEALARRRGWTSA